MFAYGQTGSGKTHTIIGGDSFHARGLAPRAIATLFRARPRAGVGSQGETTFRESRVFRDTDDTPSSFVREEKLTFVFTFTGELEKRRRRSPSEEISARVTFCEVYNSVTSLDLEFRYSLRMLETGVEASGDGDGVCSGEPRTALQKLELSKVQIGC